MTTKLRRGIKTNLGSVRARKGLELKQAEHFEDDDDNYNDSDDVEDVSVHGSWITRRYTRRQAFRLRDEKLESSPPACIDCLESTGFERIPYLRSITSGLRSIG